MEEAESNPSQEANLSLKQAKAKFLRYKLEAQRKLEEQNSLAEP